MVVLEGRSQNISVKRNPELSPTFVRDPEVAQQKELSQQPRGVQQECKQKELAHDQCEVGLADAQLPLLGGLVDHVLLTKNSHKLGKFDAPEHDQDIPVNVFERNALWGGHFFRFGN